MSGTSFKETKKTKLKKSLVRLLVYSLDVKTKSARNGPRDHLKDLFFGPGPHVLVLS